MENTIENAQDFFEAALEKWRDSPSLHFDHARCAFEYAASVRPEVVVPSEEWINGFKEEGRVASNWTIDKIKSLNPTLTFTELNHEK